MVAMIKWERQVNVYLAENGLKVNRGTIVDATIIDAPSSTKNKDKTRDPDMHQTRKGNQWYFGMKTHIGVDNQTKLIHSVAVTAANVHDSRLLDDFGTGNFVPNVAIPIHMNHHYLRCKREQSHVSNVGHCLVLVTTGVNDASAWKLPVDAGDRRS